MTAKDLKTLIDMLNQNGCYLVKVNDRNYGVDYIIAGKSIRFPREHFCIPGKYSVSSLQTLTINKANPEPFAIKWVSDYNKKTMFRDIQINDTKEGLEQLSDYIETMPHGKKVDNNSLNIFKKLKLWVILTGFMTISAITIKYDGYSVYETKQREIIRPDFVLN